jgi:hypothetical protein
MAGSRCLRVLCAWIGVVIGLAAGGCGSTKMSGTARTATEQVLLTNAWDDAIRKVDFRPLTGVPIYLDTQYVSAVDQGWVISSLREALLTQGVLLRAKPEQAQWIVEARVGAYGTDTYNWMIGVPQTSIPPTFTGVPTGTIPELPFVKRSNQQGVVKLALFAYDRASGQITWNPGTSLATSSAKDVYVGGFGPIQSGTIRSGPEFIGIRLPTLAESEPSLPKSARRSAADGPFNAPRLPASASASDLDSFAP